MRLPFQACVVALALLLFPLPFARVDGEADPRGNKRVADASAGVSYSSTRAQRDTPQPVSYSRPKDMPLGDYSLFAESVIVVGDSLSISLGQRLEEYFSHRKGVGFERLGKVSSGLSRPEFYDWERNLDELAARARPDVVVIMLGTNDTQSLKRKTGGAAVFGGQGWTDEYSARMQRLQDICRKYNPDVRVFWVGVPIMNDQNLAQDVQKINTVIKSWCQRNPNTFFIDTWDALADEKGRFTQYMPDEVGDPVKIRADDGIHLSGAGARLLAERCLRIMSAILAQNRAKPQPGPTG